MFLDMRNIIVEILREFREYDKDNANRGRGRNTVSKMPLKPLEGNL